MPHEVEPPFCRLCETQHHEDELCTGPGGETYDMRVKVGGMHSIHRQPLEDAPMAQA